MLTLVEQCPTVYTVSYTYKLVFFIFLYSRVTLKILFNVTNLAETSSHIVLYLSHQAVTARDSMAKSLYSALFDWIVLRINHALLNKKDMEESVHVRHTTYNTHILGKQKICSAVIYK